ncbi:MAG: hypothetical protein WCJ21_01150 [Planctomycetota bacterium]
MTIKVRCNGCRSKLYVSSRRQGKSIVCPRCKLRVEVPGAASAAPETRFEGPAVELPLGDLTIPPLDVFDTAPFAVNTASPPPRRSITRKQKTVILPWWVLWAMCLALLVVATGAFFVGAWWASLSPAI